ncbi:hypothetical protein CYMTET_38310 [Cymbomonas tetramitiformis]|uniref:Cyclic nucleotide-binding domain-containing protein n=1 Tax=Cymbomonas tetramitiformis TaxID=36881 RepID=A0AAE0CC90_9CHLO|nr:hypothetical protein CYMTET_38310 [Cymbomonas tetramitiformis]
MRGHMTEHTDNSVVSQIDLRRNDSDDEESPRDELLTMSAEENVEELWPGTCTHLIHPGDQIGEKSLTFNILAKSTIITLVDTVVVVLNKTKYAAALRKVEHEARKDKVRFLQSIELFSVIPRQCVDRLCMGMQIREFTEAKKIMLRFMPPDHAFIVYKGSCRELVAAENGELKPGSRTWGTKEYIGMSEAAHGVPFHRTVEAEPGSVLFSFMADDLQRHTKGLLRAQLAHPGMPIQTAEETRGGVSELIRDDDAGDAAEEMHERSGNVAEEAADDPPGKASNDDSEAPPAWFLNAKGRGSSTQLGTESMPNGAFVPQLRLRGWAPIKNSLKSANTVAMFLSHMQQKDEKTANSTKEMQAEEEPETPNAPNSPQVGVPQAPALVDQSPVNIVAHGGPLRRHQLRSLKDTLQVSLANRRAQQHLAEPGPSDESEKLPCPAPEASSPREFFRPSSVPHPSISVGPEVQGLSDEQAEPRPTTTMSLPGAFITEVSESASIPWPSSHACSPSPRGTPQGHGPLTINQFPQEVIPDLTLPPSLIRGIMTPGATPRSPDMGRASVVRPAVHASPPPAATPRTQPPQQPAAVPESHIRSASALPMLSSRKESTQAAEATHQPSVEELCLRHAKRMAASVPHVRSTKTSRKRIQLGQAVVKSMVTTDPFDSLEPQSPPRAAPAAHVWQPGRPVAKKPPPKSQPALPQAKLVAYAKNKLGLDPKRDQELLFMAQVAYDSDTKLDKLLSRRSQVAGHWQKATAKIRSAEKMMSKRNFSSARCIGQSTKLSFRSDLSNSPDPLPERVHLYEHVRARVKSLNQVVNQLYVDDYEYDVTKPGAFIRLMTQLHEHVASREKPNLERESIDHNRCLYRRNASAPKSMCC